MSASTDGESWSPVDERSIPLEDPVLVGIAACSVASGTPCEVTFEDPVLVGIAACSVASGTPCEVTFEDVRVTRIEPVEE